MSDKQQQQHEQKAQQARVKAQINRDKARRKLLQQREKLAQRRKRNRKQSEARRDDTNDDEDGVENPTAHSTMPPQKTNAENAARNSHSTVPKTPKYSDMVGRERLYGQRLHQQTTSDTAESASASEASTTPSDRDAGGDQTDE
ncbi:protein gvpI [Salarchaeum sp. JOR-1]|uniref:protein gvpI n=1 Tax=Salarchaeum sp. JOR-1 TaxID=2599399 RepID=UPI001F0EFCE7|nr:protein gvpI [Salarchaeum sp. JOR-1]